jgi:hypothetical protein
MTLYLPNVSSQSDAHRALGPLRRYLNAKLNIGLSVEPYSEPDKARLSMTIMGYKLTGVEQETDQLINWVEHSIDGQSLATELEWL